MWEMESNKLYQMLKDKRSSDYILLNETLWYKNYCIDLMFFIKRESFKKEENKINQKVSVDCDVFYWERFLKTIQFSITSTKLSNTLTEKLIEVFRNLAIEVWNISSPRGVVVIPDTISWNWNKWKWANENIIISNCDVYNHRYQFLYKYEWDFFIEHKITRTYKTLILPTKWTQYQIFKKEWLFELVQSWFDVYIKSIHVFSLKDLLSDNNPKVFFRKKDWKYFYSELFEKVNKLLKNHNFHDSEDLEVEFLFDQRKFRISLELFVWKDKLISKLKELGFVQNKDSENGKEYLEICYNETYNMFFSYKETENLFLIGWIIYLTAEYQLVKLNKNKTFTLIKEDFSPFKFVDNITWGSDIFGLNIKWKSIPNIEEFLISDQWFYSVLDNWELFISDFQWNIRNIFSLFWFGDKHEVDFLRKETIFAWWEVNWFIDIKIKLDNTEPGLRNTRYTWDVCIEQDINKHFKECCYSNQRTVEKINKCTITSVSEEVIFSFILQNRIKGKMIWEFDEKELTEDSTMSERAWSYVHKHLSKYFLEKNIKWNKISSIDFWNWDSYFRNKLTYWWHKLTRSWKFFYLLDI